MPASPHPLRRRAVLGLRLLLAGLLGLATAALVSCGSSGKGLIPLANAGPLQSDFEAVAQAAQEGDGSCAATEAAIRKTEHDLRALPASVDGGLRGRLEEGIVNLSDRARALCAQPLTPTTTTATAATATTPKTTAPPPTTTTSTQAPPPTSTTPTATTPPPAETPGGGTPAEEGQTPEQQGGNGANDGNGANGGGGGALGTGAGSGEAGQSDGTGGTGGGR